jgi:hypothetical protein
LAIVDAPNYEITATFARFPRRTTRREGKFASDIVAFVANSPSNLTAFSAIFRLASAPLAASPICTRSFGSRIASPPGSPECPTRSAYGERNFFQIFSNFALLEHSRPVFIGARSFFRRMKIGHNRPGQPLLGLHRMQRAGINFGLQAGNFGLSAGPSR